MQYILDSYKQTVGIDAAFEMHHLASLHADSFCSKAHGSLLRKEKKKCSASHRGSLVLRMVSIHFIFLYLLHTLKLCRNYHKVSWSLVFHLPFWLVCKYQFTFNVYLMRQRICSHSLGLAASNSRNEWDVCNYKICTQCIMHWTIYTYTYKS